MVNTETTRDENMSTRLTFSFDDLCDEAGEMLAGLIPTVG